MLEYWITAIRRKDVTSGRIIAFEVRTKFPNIYLPSGPKTYTAGQVVDMINNGDTFYSYTVRSGVWVRGELVDFYLATQADGRPNNNLGKLPSF